MAIVRQDYDFFITNDDMPCNFLVSFLVYKHSYLCCAKCISC